MRAQEHKAHVRAHTPTCAAIVYKDTYDNDTLPVDAMTFGTAVERKAFNKWTYNTSTSPSAGSNIDFTIQNM